MGDQQPKSKDWLSEHVKDCVGDDFSINVDDTTAISKTPDAVQMSVIDLLG